MNNSIWNVGGMQNGALRVLMQSRPTASTQRGGDTVVMERLTECLQRLGVDVVIDLEARQDPDRFSIVHLFNFATPDLTRFYAEKAMQARVPYVVTTLYEDIPVFHNQSIAIANYLIEYVRHSQDRNWWNQNRFDIHSVEVCGAFDNSWTAQNAAALLVSGDREAQAVSRAYPGSAKTFSVPFGFDTIGSASADLFFREYGVRDFVLCVGRIESRKNQLMLLKALEDSELTVVLAGGGFTYQPEYDQAVRRFVRKGRTIVLDKLSPEMLASAYCAAKVHCLPSWYELPGLVSLEAAHYGCNVVATRSGSTTDYLGDNAFYCDPWSEDSIKNAVLAGYFSPLNSDLKNIVSAFTWERSANEVLKVYREVAKPLAAAAHDSSTVTPSYVPFSAQSVVGSPVQLPFQNFDEVLQKGEEAAKNKDFIQAEQYLEQAEKLQPRSVRALRARGAVRLAQGDHIVAKSYFERALQIDAADPKTMSGLGMCLMMEKRPHDAYQYFVNALDQVPGHLVTVLQLVECSYMIERYDDLERFLRIFCASHPEDIEMLYCHAGSLYKLNRFEESHALVQKVLMRNPDHLGAKQLLDLVKEKLSGATSAPQGVANTHAASFSSNGLNSTLDTLANKYSNKWKPEQASAPTSFSNSVVSREGVLNQSAQSNIVEQVQIERTVPAAGNQAIEAELTSLEEQKRARKYGDVLDGLSTFQARQDINFAQREAAKLLEAECLVLTGQAERASTIYREVLGQNPRSARAICGGALAASRSDWAGARNHFQQALSIQPQYDVALAGLGLCANWAKETEQAWNYYQQALAVNPENTRAILGIIELGYELGRYNEIEILQTYLEMHPADLDYVYALAGCFYKQGRIRDALAEVNKITLFKPDHARALELKELIMSSSAVHA